LIKRVPVEEVPSKSNFRHQKRKRLKKRKEKFRWKKLALLWRMSRTSHQKKNPQKRNKAQAF
jgi:hypothetical protein